MTKSNNKKKTATKKPVPSPPVKGVARKATKKAEAKKPVPAAGKKKAHQKKQPVTKPSKHLDEVKLEVAPESPQKKTTEAYIQKN